MLQNNFQKLKDDFIKSINLKDLGNKLSNLRSLSSNMGQFKLGQNRHMDKENELFSNKVEITIDKDRLKECIILKSLL